MKVSGISLAGCIAMIVPSCAAATTLPGGAAQAPASLMASPIAVLAVPGMFGAPTALALRSGTGFLGANYVNPRGSVSGTGGDGNVLVCYSFGSPTDAIGSTFGVALTGIEPLGDAASFNRSASRLLHAGGNFATFAGVSVSNRGAWGVNANRPEVSRAYLSHLLSVDAERFEVPVQVMVGYSSESTRKGTESGVLEDSVFAGVGIRGSEAIRVSLSSTRTQLNVGGTWSMPGIPASAIFSVPYVTDNTERR